MRETLIKTLNGENGELFAVTDGRRFMIARCRPKIELYEYAQEIKILGARPGAVKTHHSAIVLCPEPETVGSIDADYLSAVSRFELVCDVRRGDGKFERTTFDNLIPDEIDLDGDWVFEAAGSPGFVKRLIGM
jgi:hypothetical protein